LARQSAGKADLAAILCETMDFTICIFSLSFSIVLIVDGFADSVGRPFFQSLAVCASRIFFFIIFIIRIAAFPQSATSSPVSSSALSSRSSGLKRARVCDLSLVRFVMGHRSCTPSIVHNPICILVIYILIFIFISGTASSGLEHSVRI
jgi:hypothetical protein